jgi:hypothetical protein
MTNTIRRGALLLAVGALSLVGAQTAHAAPAVCNQASPHWLGGDLIALDPPVDSPAARYTVDLTKLPGKGAGLVGAAANSPSLSVCEGDGGEVIVTTVDDPDGGVDVGDGVISVS